MASVAAKRSSQEEDTRPCIHDLDESRERAFFQEVTFKATRALKEQKAEAVHLSGGIS